MTKSLLPDRLNYELSKFQYRTMVIAIDTGNPIVTVQEPKMRYAPSLRTHLASRIQDIDDLVAMGLLQLISIRPDGIRVLCLTELGHTMFSFPDEPTLN